MTVGIEGNGVTGAFAGGGMLGLGGLCNMAVESGAR